MEETLSKTKQIPQSPPSKEAKNSSIPVSPADFRQALDTILANPTLSKDFGDCLLLTLWTVKTGNKTRQVNFARAMSQFLNTWAQSGSEE
jgi:hypothetical protein